MDDYLFLVIFGVVAFGVIGAGLAIRNSQKKEEEERQRLTRNTRKRWAAAKNIRKINWRDQFVIDDGEIDEDHNHFYQTRIISTRSDVFYGIYGNALQTRRRAAKRVQVSVLCGA